MYMCEYICVYTCICVYMYMCVLVYMYVCIYMYMCVCMYICVYIYQIYMNKNIFKFLKNGLVLHVFNASTWEQRCVVRAT